jgi:hypothetical protein
VNENIGHEKKATPPPIELSDVVWRAVKAVEEADRPKAENTKEL